MSNVLAGIGRGQLRVLGQRVAQRRAVFDAYREALADVSRVQWMPQPQGAISTRWLSCFTLEDADRASRDAVLRSLERHSIEARPVWKPMHQQPLFRDAPYFGHEGGDVAAGLFATGICLPSGSNLTPAQQQRVIEQLRRALKDQHDALA
jgi:dTDP-4-amino-4,6-dideoxygalactose transaminase